MDGAAPAAPLFFFFLIVLIEIVGNRMFWVLMFDRESMCVWIEVVKLITHNVNQKGLLPSCSSEIAYT